jgi:hypothetical protein
MEKRKGEKEKKKKNKNARKYGRSIQYFTERLRNNRSRIRERLDTRELSEIAFTCIQPQCGLSARGCGR